MILYPNKSDMDFERHKFILYGYKAIFGDYENGLDEVIKTIKEYNLLAMIETLSKISLILYSKGRYDQKTQSTLVRLVFKNNQEVINQIDRTIRVHNIPQWGIFAEQQVLLMLKLSLQYCSPDGGKGTLDDEIEKIGYCLLKLSDIMMASNVSTKINLPWEYISKELREYFFRQYFQNATESWPYKIIRYSRIIQLLRDAHPEFDIDTKFKTATEGITINTYIEIGFLLLSKWIDFSTNGADITKDWLYSKTKLFEQTALDSTEIDKLFHLLFLPMDGFVEKYEEQVTKELKGNDIFPFNFLLFQKYPLIPDRDNDLFTCSSPEYLCAKMTEGVYWIMENYFKEKGLTKEHDTWPTVWGDAYEDYIDERLNNAFGEAYIKDTNSGTGKKIDGIINGERYIFVIETKYAHWSLKAKLTGKKEDMEGTLSQLFSSKKKTKGVGQLMEYIKNIHEGKSSFPFERRHRKVIPVLIVGENMPMEPLARRLYEETAKQAGAFIQSDKILPFIVLTTGEVESLEAIVVKEGKEKAENLLHEYAKLFTERNFYGFIPNSTDFKTFLYNKKQSIPTNESIKILLKEMMERVKANAFNVIDKETTNI
jgi:hypothetical protein